MQATIITAAKGEGKTSFLRAHVRALIGSGRSVGGIAAPAVFEGDQRVGYDLIDLRTGHRRALCRVGDPREARPHAGAYRFDEGAISEGNTAITSAVRDGLEVIAIDEIGPLQFRGQGWAPALQLALEECEVRQELLIVARPALVEELANRFPSAVWATARRISPPWPASDRES